MSIAEDACHKQMSEENPSVTVGPDSGLLGLALLARFHGLAADADQLAHQFKAPGEPFGVEQILLAARSLGLKARRVASAFDRLDRVPLPALAASSAPPWSPNRDG